MVTTIQKKSKVKSTKQPKKTIEKPTKKNKGKFGLTFLFFDDLFLFRNQKGGCNSYKVNTTRSEC